MRSSDRLTVAISLLALTWAAPCANALQLAEPKDQVFGGQAVLTMADGTEQVGEITGTPTAQNGMSYIQYIPTRDDRRRIEAADIARLEVEQSKPARFEAKLKMRPELGGGLEARPSKYLEQLAEERGIDLVERWHRDVWGLQLENAVFVGHHLPNLKVGEEHRLLQLLNLGMDARIQVFRRPISGAGFFEMEREKYLLVKDGGEPVRVEKDGYEESFVALFGDCDVMAGYPHKLRKFKFFAEHLLVYDLLCPGDDEEPEETPKDADAR